MAAKGRRERRESAAQRLELSESFIKLSGLRAILPPQRRFGGPLGEPEMRHLLPHLRMREVISNGESRVGRGDR